jgi:hypothetical protein
MSILGNGWKWWNMLGNGGIGAKTYTVDTS